MPAKNCSFYVEARMALSVGVEISARSLDDAITRAKAMKMNDFVTLLGDHNDSNFRISGVFAAQSLPEA